MNILSSVPTIPTWTSLDIQNKSETPDYINDRKTKMKLPMFLLNNFPIEDIVAYERFCETDNFETNHFLSPLTSFQMNYENTNRIIQNNQAIQDMKDAKIRPYGCNKCSKVFLFKHHLLTHEKTHETGEMLLQNNKQTEEKSDVKVNSDTPIKMRPYSCNECGKSFVLKHHLTSHEKTHTGIRPHACEFCGKTFTHKHCLNTHLLLHSSERPYECTECKKRFTLKHHLISHLRVHNRDRPFACVDCGLTFALKRHLVTHSKFHAGKRPFVCDECGESFTQKDQLVMHSRFHGSLNSYVCRECGDTFTRKFELVIHGRIHGKLPHVCEVCCKEFLQKRTLISHMKEHTKEISLSCHECGCVFTTPEGLASHLKLHVADGTLGNTVYTPNKHTIYAHANDAKSNLHPPNLEYSRNYFSCHQCGCSFNTHEALMLHRKLHTGDPSLVTDICTLATNIQYKNYPNMTNGNNPKMKNTNVSPQKEKKFVCEHCSKGFVEKHGLQQHKRRHPDGACMLKSHVCLTCSKAFHQRNHLILHERQHMDPSLRNPNTKPLISYMHNDGKNYEIPHLENHSQLPIKVEDASAFNCDHIDGLKEDKRIETLN